MSKLPFWKTGKIKVSDEATRFAEKQDEQFDYYDNTVYNAGTLSEQSLCDVEELFRTFVDENAEPKSIYSESHTVPATDLTYTNVGAAVSRSADLDLTHQLKFAEEDSYIVTLETDSIVPAIHYKISYDIGHSDSSKYYWCLASTAGTEDTCDISSGDGLSITSTTKEATMAITSPLKVGQIYTVEGTPYLDGNGYGKFYLVTRIDDYRCYGDWYNNMEDAMKEENAKYEDWHIQNKYQDLLIPISSPTQTMGVLSMARDFILGEPEASFKKACITDSSGQFTEDTRIAFLENLMRTDAKNADGYLQTLAKKIIEQKEKDCKKC